MEKGKFKDCEMNKAHEDWSKCIKRNGQLYTRPDEIRSEFARDYNRILHSNAYRRLKHKTQVFFAPQNDHICTRIEHVNHVASISYTISNYLGLNTELVKSIAIGHDLGHPPFGHQGETVIEELHKKYLDGNFWHEKNSLYLIDNIELLENNRGKREKLCLTYAVRDGIICHCGEVDDSSLRPRDEYLVLEQIEKESKKKRPEPFTWEGCVVKLADKIAYLGRDIEDAITLDILTRDQQIELAKEIKRVLPNIKIDEINNGNLIHNFIINICKTSTPETGIRLSTEYAELMQFVKEYNYKYIYKNSRLDYYKKYSTLIIESIYEELKSFYSSEPNELMKAVTDAEKRAPELISYFKEWLYKYSNLFNEQELEPIIIIEDEKSYYKLILNFISCMTDNFAKRAFDELTRF